MSKGVKMLELLLDENMNIEELVKNHFFIVKKEQI
jgi:hypothetical protein